MDRRTRAEWLRLLNGELSGRAARETRQRILENADLAASFRQLERTWEGLELPPPKSTPPGFGMRVGARARSSGQGVAPQWWRRTLAGRAATVGIVAAGIVLGSLLATPSQSEDWGDYLSAEPSWAEDYLTDVESVVEILLPEEDS